MFLALSSVLPHPMIQFHVRLHSTCSRTWDCPWCFALDPSGWGSNLCLRILFAPCNCRRVSWWSSLRPRVFESSSLSPGFFPFRGPTPVSRLFLSLRPRRSRSPVSSLAPSWWSPCPLMRWALLTLSCYVLSVPSAFSLYRSCLSIPFSMSPLLRCVFADGTVHCERSLLRNGHLPMCWVPSEPMGFAVAPPISPYTGPGQSPRSCRTPMGAQVCVSYFSCATFRMYSWR